MTHPMQTFSAIVLLFSSLSAHGLGLPQDPTDPNHPGSRVYSSSSFKEVTMKCQGREVSVFIPPASATAVRFPVIVYGHGMALGLENDRKTMEHLAKKGIAGVYPTYDSGFFDQDWTRMGRDYATLTECALKAHPELNPDQVIFSGFSKGAYVASVATGLVFKEKLAVRPKAAIFFEPAGSDMATLPSIDPSVIVTVVFADADTTVKRADSEAIFKNASATKKQFIDFKSYTQTTPTLKADHFWPLTKGSFVGGLGESAFHPQSMWKWLGGIAEDVRDQTGGTNRWAYGADAADKGIPGFQDVIRKTW